MVPMRLTLKPVMVKMTPVCEICMVFPIEPCMIVFIVGAVVIVATPCRITIIRISWISSFVDADLHMNLCAGGIDRHGGRDDHSENK